MPNPLTIFSAVLQKLPTNVRLTLYVLGFGVALLAPWAASHGWISTTDTETLTRVALILTGGTAGVVLAGQKRDGTLDFSGPPAEQAIAYARAAAERAANSATAAVQDAIDLERVKTAVTDAVKDVPVLGPLAQQAIDALDTHR